MLMVCNILYTRVITCNNKYIYIYIYTYDITKHTYQDCLDLLLRCILPTQLIFCISALTATMSHDRSHLVEVRSYNGLANEKLLKKLYLHLLLNYHSPTLILVYICLTCIVFLCSLFYSFILCSLGPHINELKLFTFSPPYIASLL